MTCRFFRETGIRTRLALGATETAERKRRGVATSTSSIGSTSNGMRATTRSLITAMWSLVTATEATTRRSSLFDPKLVMHSHHHPSSLSWSSILPAQHPRENSPYFFFVPSVSRRYPERAFRSPPPTKRRREANRPKRTRGVTRPALHCVRSKFDQICGRLPFPSQICDVGFANVTAETSLIMTFGMKYFEGHRVQQGGGDVLEQDALLGPVRDRTNRVADVAKARVVRRRHHGDVVWGVTRRVWVRGGCGPTTTEFSPAGFQSPRRIVFCIASHRILTMTASRRGGECL